MPLRGLVWGLEQIETYVHDALTNRLKGIPADRIQPPEPTVAGPALEALRFAGKEEALREMYANLLATAMDRHTAERAHPAFVEVIKQLSPDEAKLLALVAGTAYPVAQPHPVIIVRARAKEGLPVTWDLRRHLSLLGVQAGCLHPHLTTQHLDNLCRLGLIIIPEKRRYPDDAVYEERERHPNVQHLRAQIEAQNQVLEIERETLELTDFDQQS